MIWYIVLSGAAVAMLTAPQVLMDSNGTVYENKHLTTAYQPEE